MITQFEFFIFSTKEEVYTLKWYHDGFVNCFFFSLCITTNSVKGKVFVIEIEREKKINFTFHSQDIECFRLNFVD